MTSLTISLPDPLMALVEQKVASGGYSGPSAFFISLLEGQVDSDHLDEDTERLVLEGLISAGPDIPGTPEFWDNIRAKAALLDQRYDRRLATV